eukprot:6703961-Prymnesium_polylepis.1
MACQSPPKRRPQCTRTASSARVQGFGLALHDSSRSNAPGDTLHGWTSSVDMTSRLCVGGATHQGRSESMNIDL